MELLLEAVFKRRLIPTDLHLYSLVQKIVFATVDSEVSLKNVL